MNIDALRRIYSQNLGVKPGEKVLVFTDKLTKKERAGLSEAETARREVLPEIARAAADIGIEYSAREVIYLEYPSGGGPALEPPEALWEAAFGKEAVQALIKSGLLKEIFKKRIDEDGTKRAEAIIKKSAPDAVNAVIALSNWSTSHTLFRKLLTRVCLTRYASMPLFDAGMLEGPMQADYAGMKKRAQAVAKMLKGAAQIELTAPNGTKLFFEAGGRPVLRDAGDLKKPGSFGNLPAGEVYLAPVEGTAEGELVIEWGPTRKLASPVRVKIQEGNAADVQGDEPFVKELSERLAQAPENRNIAELGIGINPLAKRPDNILESEKILGTAHVALGANITFGGKVKAPYHQDFVFFGPTVTVTTQKGETGYVIKDGELQA